MNGIQEPFGDNFNVNQDVGPLAADGSSFVKDPNFVQFFEGVKKEVKKKILSSASNQEPSSLGTVGEAINSALNYISCPLFLQELFFLLSSHPLLFTFSFLVSFLILKQVFEMRKEAPIIVVVPQLDLNRQADDVIQTSKSSSLERRSQDGAKQVDGDGAAHAESQVTTNTTNDGHVATSSVIKKSKLFPTSSSDDCMRFLFDDVRTLAQVMDRGARVSLAPTYDCLGTLVHKSSSGASSGDGDGHHVASRVTFAASDEDIKDCDDDSNGAPKEAETEAIPIVKYGVAPKGRKKEDPAPKTVKSWEYQFMSYSKVRERISNFAAGLMNEMKDLVPRASKIGIYATNCADYVIAEFGAYEHSLIVVPLYDTLGPNAVSFVIKEAGISVVLVDSEERFECLLSQYQQTAPSATIGATSGPSSDAGAKRCDDSSSLKIIIVINEGIGANQRITQSKMSKARGLGLNVVTMSAIERIGAKVKTSSAVQVTKPRPRDLAVICYTSGTTGNPKGAMLTHENVMANLSSVLYQLGQHAPGPGDTYMSFLPLAHMFERCSVAASLMVGARIGFFGGNIKELSAEMEILSPTFLPSVPRLFNRIYDKVYSQVARSKVKRFMLRKGLEAKSAELKAGIYGSRDTIWDKLIFNKVKDGMGGKVRLIVVGSAPTSPAVLHFMRCALSCIICEGYGQTECVCPCTLTLPGDVTTGHVGPPLASAYIKLLDVPEMEYYARDNQGEVCVRGPIVFQGYLNDKSEGIIDNDGWLHTGDIGSWNPNGTLSIIDRKKHIFKLSQGEFISPEKIESVYARSRFVAQIFVYGESIKSSLVAIVVPETEMLLNWARDHHHPSILLNEGSSSLSHDDGVGGALSRLCGDLKVKQVILEDLYALGRKDGALKGFEQVRDIYLTHEPFSIGNGLLTPTLKTKRPACRKFFGSQIEQMYRGLD